MTNRRAAVFAVFTLFAAGCGGGGGGGTHPRVPATSATSTQSIGVGGGTASVNFGIYTATVTVPAGALPTTTTVSITLYSPGHGPQVLQSTQRRTLALGTGATELAEIVLDTGGEAPVLPLKLSLIGVATPASGTSIRLAGYGTADGFTDVDTVTLTSNTAAEDDSTLYPDASAANHTVYGFYEIPSANVQPPPTPVITGVNPNPAPASTTTQLTVTETNGNGFPFLTGTYSFTISNTGLGTITSAGLLTAGSLDASGTVTVTDTTAGRGSPSGSPSLSISSSRPGAIGDAFSFTGTISATDQLTTVTQPQVSSGTVALTVTPSSQAVTGSGTAVTSMWNEVDTYKLQTVTTNTSAVTNYGATNVALASTDATDSNQVEYITTYGSGNGLLDVLPEATGSFGPNNAALTYMETDPGNYSTSKTVNTDGTYVENDYDPFGDTQTITLNADESGEYNGSQFATADFTFGAPTGSPATIFISAVYQGQTETVTIPSWMPAAAVPSMETDVDNGSTPFPAGCSVPAKYGTSGNQIVQTITRTDGALGSIETETVTTYVTPANGPACTVMTDHTASYYDFAGLDLEHLLTFTQNGVTPVETTDLAETLTLSSATTPAGTLSSGRQTASGRRSGTSQAAAGPRTSLMTPLAIAKSRFEHLVRDHLKTRDAILKRHAAFHGAHLL